MLALIAVGLFGTTGTAHWWPFAYYIVVLCVAYALAVRLLAQHPMGRRTACRMPHQVHGYALIGLSAATFAFMLYHANALRWPLRMAWDNPDMLATSKLREQTTVPFALVSYLSGILARAIAPFLCFYFYQQRRFVLLAATIFITSIYLLNLLQKSFIFLSFVPLLLYCFYHRHLWHAMAVAALIAFSFLVLASINTVSNMSRQQPIAIHTAQQEPDAREHSRIFWHNYAQRNIHLPAQALPDPTQRMEKVFGGLVATERWPRAAVLLVDRVFIVPGYVVGVWFDLIPASIPFTGGCNYRFIAPLQHCDFQNLPAEIWRHMNADYAAQGLNGTMNAASMAENYAAFGLAGLLIEGMMMGVLLALTERLFSGRPDHYLVFNAIPLLMLSSVALPYTLLSGGWLCSLALYALFCREEARGERNHQPPTITPHLD